MEEVGKDRHLDIVSQWVQLSVYLGICLFVCLGFFSWFFLNFDKAFAFTAGFGHQPAHASKQNQTLHFYFL